LKSVDSVDILDVLASSIKIEFFNNTIKRILPNLNDQLNEEWITNNARFYYDSLSMQRLGKPKFWIKLRIINIS